jgi:hypothetical protein
VAGTQALGNDKIERLAYCLVSTMREDPLGTWIPHLNDPLAVGRHHGVSGGGQDRIRNQSVQIHTYALVFRSWPCRR